MSIRFFSIGDTTRQIRITTTDDYVDAKGKKWPRGTLILGKERLAHFKNLHDLDRRMRHCINKINKETHQHIEAKRGLDVAKQVMSLPGKMYSPEGASGVMQKVKEVIAEGLKRSRTPKKKELRQKVSHIDVRGSKGGLIPAATIQKVQPIDQLVQGIIGDIGSSKEDLERLLKDLSTYETEHFQKPLRGIRTQLCRIADVLLRMPTADPVEFLHEDWLLRELLRFPKGQPAPYSNWIPQLVDGLTLWASNLARMVSASGSIAGPTILKLAYKFLYAVDWIRIYYYTTIDLFTISCVEDAADDDLHEKNVIESVTQESRLFLPKDEQKWFREQIDFAIAPFLASSLNREEAKDRLKDLLAEIDKKIIVLLMPS